MFPELEAPLGRDEVAFGSLTWSKLCLLFSLQSELQCKCLQVICHGIPDSRPLVEGDIVNLDVSVYYQGFHGDLNETFVVGQTTDDASKKLVKAAHDVSRVFFSTHLVLSQ